MDGLLLDTERIYFEGFRRARLQLDLPDIDHLFLGLIGLNIHNSKRKLQEGLGDLVDVASFDAQWTRENFKLLQKPIPIKKGVSQLLKKLTHSNLPYAIATSTSTDKANEHLDRANLRNHFPVLVGGDQVSNGKPAPDIFLKAAERLAINQNTVLHSKIQKMVFAQLWLQE